jgi:DNA repair exonuclease SbcCD ATPase subunit
MKLVSVSATNLKGAPFTFSLTPVTVIVGKNFAGKTRIIDAIIVGLLGFHPALGKTARATFSLASGKDMEVKLTFDDGSFIRRRFYLKGDSVKVEEEVPEAFENTDQLAVMMDAGQYFALSDRDRVTYVADHCPSPANVTTDAILSRVEFKARGEWPAEKFDVISKAIYAKAAADEVFAPQAFVELAIAHFQGVWKEAKASQERMAKTIQGLSELRLQDDPSVALVVMEERKAGLTNEIAGLMEKRGALLGSFTAMKSANLRRQEIDRELRFAHKGQLDLVEAKNKLALVTKQVEATPSITHEELRLLWTEVSRCKGIADQLSVAADTQQKAMVRAERLLASLDEHTCCPYCGAEGADWKKKNAVELAKNIAEAGALYAEALQKKKDTLVDYDQALAKHTAKVEEQRARLALDSEYSLAVMAVNRLEGQLTRVTTLEEELGRLVADNPQLSADVESLQSNLNVKNDQLRTLEREMQVGQGRVMELKRLADAEKERDEAKAEQDVAAAAGKELRVIQAELVEAAFKPLLQKANSFFAGVLRAPLAYNASEGGDLGMWVSGQWISHHTMSGTERALCYAAIQMALASSLPVKLMLLDELGRLDDTSIAKVMSAVSEAVESGEIDGVVGIDAGRAPFYGSVRSGLLSVINIK